ncbi:MAG: TIGR04282 family arsenosugar biosynthesis glycosyltransferase [Pseudomonadota bacterium]
MSAAATTTELIVFAKAPVAGQAKTRLIPALGPAGAAALAERLLGHAITEATSAGLARVELCAAPDTTHPVFARLASQHPGLHLAWQGDGDLGERMHRALNRRLADERPVLLIGTDAPALDAAALRAAAEALADVDAVFVPALDGGYALVGLQQPQAELFLGLVWSTPQVMAETRARAQRAGLRWVELPAVADIDEPADLLTALPPGWLP